MSDAGRALVAMRRTVEATCSLDGCDVVMAARIKDKQTGELERRYCSPAHRAKAYYRQHKQERLEYQRRRRATPRTHAGEGER